MRIQRLDKDRATAHLRDLVRLLQDSVEGGASVGFLPPLSDQDAEEYWSRVINDLPAGQTVLLAGFQSGKVVASVELALAWQPNACHRAEVRKLMVLSAVRRQGIGAALVQAVEEAAREQERTLLFLDTRRGDVSEALYRKVGYTPAGIIPDYARSADGQLADTVFYYKRL